MPNSSQFLLIISASFTNAEKQFAMPLQQLPVAAAASISFSVRVRGGTVEAAVDGRYMISEGTKNAFFIVAKLF
jgi:hypothetical protein